MKLNTISIKSIYYKGNDKIIIKRPMQIQNSLPEFMYINEKIRKKI